MPKEKLRVEPELMRWARASLGLSRRQASGHFKISSDELTKWESEGAALTPSRLDRVAEYYKRPTAAFFLPEPPEEPPAPIDFRLFPGSEPRKLSPKALLALRRARWLQAAYADFGENVPSPALRASLGDDIERLARRARESLGVTVDRQKSWKTTGRSFHLWRSAFEEEIGVAVFVFPVPANDLRGCSLGGDRGVILISSKDYSQVGRTFTLFHEWCHLLLGKPGICYPDEGMRSRADASVETYCNQFAAEFLIPRKTLLAEPIVARYCNGALPLDRAVAALAAVYSVSRQVALRRLRTENLVARGAYDTLMQLLSAPLPERKVKMKGRTTAERAIAELGPGFVGHALTAAERGSITYRDLSDYLSVKPTQIDALQETLLLQ